MAKYQKKKIQETEDSGFGQYKEGVGGGGSPEAGDPTKHGHGVNSDYRQANNDTMQPRTNDGKFTYKSVNGQSIDPKYGPSRGKTVNPLLTQGQNGVMIEDVESQFSQKSGALWNKYKDKWYTKGGEMVLLSQGSKHKEKWTTRVAGEAIWDVAKKRYDKVKGEFLGESKTFEEGKKGASTQEEKLAKQQAETTGEEQAVIEQPSGGIKLKPGVTPFAPKPQPQPRPSGSTVGKSPVSGVGSANSGITQPGATLGDVSSITNADYAPKYSDDDISAARDALKESGFSDDDLAKFDALSPKEKDEYIDQYFDTEEEVEEEKTETTETETEEPKEENENKEGSEEESEAVKTVKKLGFTDEEEDKK